LLDFSPLQVTRELEKDIALAKQQLAQASNSKVERAQQYKLMLRTLDCVTRWGTLLVAFLGTLAYGIAGNGGLMFENTRMGIINRDVLGGGRGDWPAAVQAHAAYVGLCHKVGIS
jgi:hypothetical protein